MMLALLFDGARALVLRRQMQNASDAAAMAGANVIQGLSPKQCSATAGPPPGAAGRGGGRRGQGQRGRQPAQLSAGQVIVTCVADPLMANQGVKVRLDDDSPTFFGSIFGGGPLSVATDSSAVNGNNISNNYSVVMLDPQHLTWPNGQRGCPSFQLSGGPTVIFDSAIYIDSACTSRQWRRLLHQRELGVADDGLWRDYSHRRRIQAAGAGHHPGPP